MPQNKLRLTQTLLSNWKYVYKTDDGYEKFLKCLNREKEPPTSAMLDGIRFEGCINSVLDGAPIDEDHEWYKQVSAVARYLKGAEQQVEIIRDITVDGVTFQLQGILDFLRAGIIYDTKFVHKYQSTIKYLNSPQHPMYFYLVPEAYEFQYIICDGKQIYRETYRPEETVPIETTIRQFMHFLEQRKLIDTYVDKWKPVFRPF